ncbi:MAG TPA: DUF2795 domain-containing protein [Aquihabitans sp.]|jgi:hypothetical protein|nr:DUF2795 domain-containing protein [Aquihabitans sp.]
MTDHQPPPATPDEAGRIGEAFAASLADATFPATREELLAAATEAGAPSEVLDLMGNLDDVAPFTSIDQAWEQAAGPDAT